MNNKKNELQSYLYSLSSDERIPLVVDLCEQVEIIKKNGRYISGNIKPKRSDRLQQQWDEVWLELTSQI